MDNPNLWWFVGVLLVAVAKQTRELVQLLRNRTPAAEGVPLRGWGRLWPHVEGLASLLFVFNLALTLGLLGPSDQGVLHLAFLWSVLLVTQKFPAGLLLPDVVHSSGVRYLGSLHPWSHFSAVQDLGGGKLRVVYQRPMWGFRSFRIRVEPAKTEEVLALGKAGVEAGGTIHATAL